MAFASCLMFPFPTVIKKCSYLKQIRDPHHTRPEKETRVDNLNCCFKLLLLSAVSPHKLGEVIFGRRNLIPVILIIFEVLSIRSGEISKLIDEQNFHS